MSFMEVFRICSDLLKNKNQSEANASFNISSSNLERHRNLQWMDITSPSSPEELASREATGSGSKWTHTHLKTSTMKKLALKKSTSLHHSLLLIGWTNSSRNLNMVSFYLTELFSEVFLLCQMSPSLHQQDIHPAPSRWPGLTSARCASTCCLLGHGLSFIKGHQRKCWLFK